MRKELNEIKEKIESTDITDINIPHKLHPSNYGEEIPHEVIPSVIERKTQIFDNIETVHAESVEDNTLSLEDAEKEMIKKALERNNGKRKKCAEELKISERTLYRKIKEYNLD